MDQSRLPKTMPEVVNTVNVRKLTKETMATEKEVDEKRVKPMEDIQKLIGDMKEWRTLLRGAS